MSDLLQQIGLLESTLTVLRCELMGVVLSGKLPSGHHAFQYGRFQSEKSVDTLNNIFMY